MVSKNTKAKKRATVTSNANGDPPTSPTSDGDEQVASSSRSSPEPDQPVAEDPEKIKDKGNEAFKTSRYQEAIQHYTRAIELKPTEFSYYTNRAASYIALKRFKPALDDCQYAITLMPKPVPEKFLLRLARCQAALGNNIAARSTLSTILEADKKNAQAIQMKNKIEELDTHLRNFETAKQKRDWGMARLALGRCLNGVEAEETEKPLEWRLWRIELELAKGSWDAASIAANEALRQDPNSPEVLCLRGLVLFLTGKLPQALSHVQSALRLDSGFRAAQDLRKRIKEVTRLKDEGNDLFKSGKLNEAVEKYSEALQQIGDKEEEGKGGQIRATLLSNRATTLLKLEKYEEALDDTNVSLELAPGAFKALRTRARLNLQLEKYDGAVGDFKSAIEQAQMEGSDADVKALRIELKKAEAALKRSKTKDYYKILGVARDCADSEIKKAYRKESLKHHPDKGGDEEKFKLVSEAYAVLSDPERRRRYDLGEDEDGMSGASGFGGGMNGMGMNPEDIAEIFAQFHGGGGGGFSFGGGGGHSHSHGHGFGGGARRGGFSFSG